MRTFRNDSVAGKPMSEASKPGAIFEALEQRQMMSVTGCVDSADLVVWMSGGTAPGSFTPPFPAVRQSAVVVGGVNTNFSFGVERE